MNIGHSALDVHVCRHMRLPSCQDCLKCKASSMTTLGSAIPSHRCMEKGNISWFSADVSREEAALGAWHAGLVMHCFDFNLHAFESDVRCASCRGYSTRYQDQSGAAGRGRGRGRLPATSSPVRAAPSPDRAAPAYGRGPGRGTPQHRGMARS